MADTPDYMSQVDAWLNSRMMGQRYAGGQAYQAALPALQQQYHTGIRQNAQAMAGSGLRGGSQDAYQQAMLAARRNQGQAQAALGAQQMTAAGINQDTQAANAFKAQLANRQYGVSPYSEEQFRSLLSQLGNVGQGYGAAAQNYRNQGNLALRSYGQEDDIATGWSQLYGGQLTGIAQGIPGAISAGMSMGGIK